MAAAKLSCHPSRGVWHNCDYFNQGVMVNAALMVKLQLLLYALGGGACGVGAKPGTSS